MTLPVPSWITAPACGAWFCYRFLWQSAARSPVRLGSWRRLRLTPFRRMSRRNTVV